MARYFLIRENRAYVAITPVLSVWAKYDSVNIIL